MATWTSLDSWIALTAALAGMSCAVPGVFLVLRKQSMLGDALSHTVLPGIVVAFLVAHWFRVDETKGAATPHLLLLGGAVAAGLLTAFLTELIQKLGRVESSAALGVVYSSLFALGLLLIRLFADSVHLDADCVLFGAVETSVLETWGDTSIPVAAVLNGSMLLANSGLVLLCFKELKLTTFDPGLAESLGLRSSLVNYVLMALTSMTLVAAFESVGTILVVTMLVTPASVAFLLTHRFSTLIWLAVGIAGLSAVIGHGLAISAPSLILKPLGFSTVDDSSTAGMAALTCGLLFGLAMLLSPQNGIVIKAVRHALLSFRIAREDLLGMLYRSEEAARSLAPKELRLLDHPRFISPLLRRLAIWRLSRGGLIAVAAEGYVLTQSGRETAKKVVRSHRLWELYMARHFTLPNDHLHATAARVEHFLDDAILSELEQELDRPGSDPHGRAIPGG